MITLGIETSCDETAAAVVENGTKLLCNVVKSQIDLHKAFGGVVPEIAARSHIEVILPVINQALQDARKDWLDIDAIGIANGPGLIGSLLIGTLTACVISATKSLPLYPINHVEAHVYANFLLDPQPQFPLLALIVSGGHTQLVFFKDHGDYELLGQTNDDAVGEAFDKVAKILGLPYPGGPSISLAAEHGDPYRYPLPKAHMQGAYDFSFSGLKTAVLRQTQAICNKPHNFPSSGLAGLLTSSQRDDMAASFQRIAIETLVDKTIKAFHEFLPQSVVIAGGVAANSELRRQLQERLPVAITYPPMSLCTDNAAMIAAETYYKAQYEEPIPPTSIQVSPTLSM